MHTQTSATRPSAFRRLKDYRLSGKMLIVLVLISLVFTGWTQGTFDHALVNVGLNYNDCARNGFGATFCGDELTEYKQRIGDR